MARNITNPKSDKLGILDVSNFANENDVSTNEHSNKLQIGSHINNRCKKVATKFGDLIQQSCWSNNKPNAKFLGQNLSK